MLVAALALGGCRWLVPGDAAEFSPVQPAHVKRVELCAPRACRDSLDVVALGVSGYLFVPWRDTTGLVLTPPAFRNPSVWRFLLGWDWLAGTAPDTARITRRLASMTAAGPDRLRRVRAVLVGHAHYDHLLDLPAMARWLPEARVYGSATVANLLAGAPAFAGPLGSAPRLVAIDSAAGYDMADRGEWTMVEGSQFRFKAIAWQHARNFPGYTFAKGDVLVPARGLPRTAAGWKMGRVYAYSLDLLDAAGAVACRFVIQDAAASPRVVARANGVWRADDPAPATVTIISAANYDRVDAYPDSLLALQQPGHVVLGHWEEFFRSPEKALKRVRGIRGRDLVQRMQRVVGNRWTALAPGATLRVVF